ncbi:MAG: hypothetical protein Q4E94_03450, partial [Clostridia bacterium]|nr:hypothetical protein [Clostridia bacterium]
MWFISYVAVSLITVLFNFIAYTRIDTSVSTQNKHYVMEILGNRKSDIDNLRCLVSNVAIEISQKDKVRKLAFM